MKIIQATNKLTFDTLKYIFKELYKIYLEIPFKTYIKSLIYFIYLFIGIFSLIYISNYNFDTIYKLFFIIIISFLLLNKMEILINFDENNFLALLFFVFIYSIIWFPKIIFTFLILGIIITLFVYLYWYSVIKLELKTKSNLIKFMEESRWEYMDLRDEKN